MKFKFLTFSGVVLFIWLFACTGPNGSNGNSPNGPKIQQQANGCTLVPTGGFGPTGTTQVHFEKVFDGLEVPWGIAFLPGGDWLITERPGRVRLAQNGKLASAPVVTIQTGESGEGGLLGIALDPQYPKRPYFYVYYTVDKNGTNVNRLARYQISADHTSATENQVLVDDIPSGTFHNGGRVKFGPDGMIYVGTGDSRDPNLAQDPTTLAGKIIRVTPDGAIPHDNPDPTKYWYVRGVRNTEAFDWIDPQTMIIADNGPTGELGETGGDKVNIVHSGDNLGWPTIWHCDQSPGLNTSILSWVDAVPPGGGMIYHGNKIPGWDGSFLIGTMGAEHLHRVVFNSGGLVSHEVYFQGGEPAGEGRLREVIQAPDGELYVTTTNCDSRGSCPSQKDMILKVSPGA